GGGACLPSWPPSLWGEESTAEPPKSRLLHKPVDLVPSTLTGSVHGARGVDPVSLPGKFGKAWRRLSALSSSGDRLARIESQMSATFNRPEPFLAPAPPDPRPGKISRAGPHRPS